MAGKNASMYRRSRSTQLLVAEAGINLLRAVAIAMLYVQHLFSYFATHDADLSAEYHDGVNLIVLLSSMMILIVHLMLRRNRWPIWLTYSTIIVDGLLVSALITLAGGPHKIQVILLPLVIMVSALRLQRRTVWLSTAVAIAAYLITLADYALVKVGGEVYYAPGNEALRIPRHDQFFVVAALLICGIIAHRLVLNFSEVQRDGQISMGTKVVDENAVAAENGENE